MKRALTWFKNLFAKDSNVSSKRFAGVTLLIWAMVMGSYYILKVQWGGVESNTTVSVLEFAIVSGVGLLAGGTVAEQVGSGVGKTKQKESKKKSNAYEDEV